VKERERKTTGTGFPRYLRAEAGDTSKEYPKKTKAADVVFLTYFMSFNL